MNRDFLEENRKIRMEEEKCTLEEVLKDEVDELYITITEYYKRTIELVRTLDQKDRIFGCLFTVNFDLKEENELYKKLLRMTLDELHDQRRPVLWNRKWIDKEEALQYWPDK